VQDRRRKRRGESDEREQRDRAGRGERHGVLPDFVVVLCRMAITAYSLKSLNSQYVYFMRLKNGLVAEAWELTDTASTFELLAA
jgi:hypothetical protein